MNRFAVVVALAAGLTTGVGAQQDKNVPAALIPPKGMCRILLDGVPVTQQPAPTDCKTAVKNRPANGRVLFGDDYAKTEGGKTEVPKRNGSPPPAVLPQAKTPPVVPPRPRVKPPE